VIDSKEANKKSQIDLEAPQVISVTSAQTQASAGSKRKIFIEVTDNQSGLSLYPVFVFREAQKDGVSVDQRSLGQLSEELMVVMGGAMKPTDIKDVYVVEFEIENPQFMDDSQLFRNGLTFIVQPEAESSLDDGSVFSFIQPQAGSLTRVGETQWRYEFEVMKSAPVGPYLIEGILIHDTSARHTGYLASVKGGKSAIERTLLGWLLTSQNIYSDKDNFDLVLPSETDLVYRTEDNFGDDGTSNLPVVRFEVISKN
jgi:hypothetical protein